MQIRAVGMRNYTLVVLVWSMKAVTAGDDDDLKIAGDPERKGNIKLAPPNAPLDDSFLLDAPLDEAHHRGHLPESGEASTLVFFLGSGGQYLKMVRAGEGLRENGLF
jgi:hypothetical protein